MLKEFAISNFKSFSGMVNIPIKPITLIFGANSSGKSSIFQSLLLLKQTLEESTSPKTVLLTKGSYVDLGTFNDFINSHDNNKEFSFRASIPLHKSKEYFGGVEQEISDLDFPETDNYLYLENPDDRFFLLKFSLNKYKEVHIEVVFKNNIDKKHPEISEMCLYVGDNKNFFAKYMITNNDIRLSEINLNHNYWHSYFFFLFDFILDENKNDLSKLEELYNQLYPDYQDVKTLKYYVIYKYIIDIYNDILKENAYSKPDYEIVEKDIQSIIRDIRPEDIINTLFSEIVTILKEDSVILKNFLPYCDSSIYEKIYKDLYRSNFFNSSHINLILCSAAYMLKEAFKMIIYMGPIRSNPDRYYFLSGDLPRKIGISGEMFPTMLFRNRQYVTDINELSKKFDLGYEIDTSEVKNDIFTLTLKNIKTGVISSLRDVGFGVSQVLPILMQSIIAQGQLLLIEQPELHLHPKLQAELGDVFIKSALGDSKNCFLIETHSEHLILRILRRIRETTLGELPEGYMKIKPEDVCVLYAQPGLEGTRLFDLRITDDGDFADKWPDGFFTERTKELF